MTTSDPSTPADAIPTDAIPVDATPADAAAPSDAAPSDAAPADVAPADVVPADVVPADVVPADVVPADVVPADVVPADVVPADVVPADVVPADVVPADAAPADAAPADAAPADVAPADAAPADAVPAVPAPRGAEADPRLLIARVEDAADAAPQQGSEEPAQSAGSGADSAPVPAAPVQVEAQAAAAASPAPAVAAVPQPPAAPQLPAGPAPAPHPYGAAQPQPQPQPYPYGAPQPQMPPQPYPYADPAAAGQGAGAVWAVPPAYAPKARKARPWLRTVGRWTAAVAVMAVVGAVTTALVVRPARTDVPGLATPSDGRWDFPALTLPTLPPGNGPAGTDGRYVHRVDLRQLLLPAPTGATAEASLPGTHGWYPTASLLGLLSNPEPVKATLQDSGLRHVAASGWTMPDGTRTQIYLQQFRSLATASDVDVVESISGSLAAAPDAGTAAGIDLAGISQSTIHAQAASGSRRAVTYVYLQAGDTEVLVVMSNPKTVPTVDFEQVVELQNRLLTAGA